MSDIGGQAGSFNTSYNNNRAANINRDNKVVATKTPSTPTQNKTSDVQTLNQEFNKLDLVNSVIQQQLDAQQIQDQVQRDRNTQVDSFQSSETAGANREETATNFSGQVSEQKYKENTNRQQLAQMINHAQLGHSSASSIKPSVEENPQLASKVSEQISTENLDPDAKAKKDLNAKLKRIQDAGGPKGKDFVRFVSSQINEKGLVPDSILELVDGFLQTIKGNSLTPAEMIKAGGDGLPIIAIKDKIAASNKGEIQELRRSLAESIAVSGAERADLLTVRNLNKPKAKMAPPKPMFSDAKLTKQEAAIGLIIAINNDSLATPWDSPIAA